MFTRQKSSMEPLSVTILCMLPRTVLCDNTVDSESLYNSTPKTHNVPVVLTAGRATHSLSCCMAFCFMHERGRE